MTTRINISSDSFLADAVDKLRRGYEDLAKSLAEKLVNTFVGSDMAAHGKAVALIKKIKWGA